MKNNIFNDDFQDLLKAFNEANVKYILVGGYSVILHGYSRTTGDMDLWVEKSKENYLKIVLAFRDFGMPTFDMTEVNFLENPKFDVFRFGRPPVSIDILNKVKGLEFSESYSNSIDYEVTEEIKIKLIHYDDLLLAKKAAGRFRDLNDIEHLTKNKK
jgi:predicted nucleotidyltransferase